MTPPEYVCVGSSRLDDRIDWVDVAKGFGILLVVYGHVGRGLAAAGIIPWGFPYKTIDSWIYLFHMPLFFFLSGIFFKQAFRKYGLWLVVSRFSSIAWPYIVWSLVQGISKIAVSEFTNRPIHIVDVLSLLWAPMAQFWFLYVLYIVVVGHALLFYLLRPPFGALGAVAVGFILYAIPTESIAWVAGGLLCKHAVFFSLGVIVGLDRVARVARRPVACVGIVLAFIAGSAWFHSQGWTYDVGPGASRLLLASLGIGATVCVAISRFGRRAPLVAMLGRRSLEIYLMHILAGSGARIVLAKGFGVSAPAVHLIAGVSIGVVLPVVAAIIIERLRMDWLFRAPSSLGARYWASPDRT